ncbi:MAG: hypothetical protein ACHQ6T_03380 [Myxococcota bacterium]
MTRIATEALYPGGEGVTQEELRSDLLEFSGSFTVLVTEAADRISAATADSSQRRLSLLWKIRIPPLAREAAGKQNPRTGYVEALTVAVAHRQYFQDGAGASLFGAQQPIALETAKEIEQNALKLGQSFLPPEKLAELHAEVEELARQHPLRGEFLRERIQVGLAKAETGGAFDDIIGIPMAPFRAIGGVESGAQAIHEFNGTAAQFTEIVDQLPQRMRWQLELLSYDLQENGGVLEQSLDSMQRVAESASRLSLAAERLPADTREAIENVSGELEKRSSTLKALLVEYRGAIGETGATAESVSKLVDAISRSSEQLNQAGVAWSGLVKELRAPSLQPPGQAEDRAFDIREYEKTAIEIRSTAEAVRALLGDLTKTREGVAADITDRLLRDGIILIGVFFASLLAYRLVAARVVRGRE